jgi:hypothetical protein
MKLWALKRQAVGLSIVSVIILATVGYGIYSVVSQTSCRDGIKNGLEEGPDCGAICGTVCLPETPRDPLRLWARFFPLRDGVYDAGALIENLNLSTGAREAKYLFKLYDASDVLLAKREGSTWLYPKQKTFIYEPQFMTGSKVPARVDFSIEAFKWEPLSEGEPLQIEVASKRFLNDPHPTVSVTLANRSLFEEQKLEVSVFLERADGNVYAASRTIVERLEGEMKRDITFSWPNSNFETPHNISILYRRVLE